MALSNYTELQAAIVTHAARDGDPDFVPAVPTLIALAHSRLNRDLRCRDMEAQATITITNGVGDLPDDYLQFIEVRDGGSPSRVLSAVDPNYGDEMYPTAAAGCASFFAIMGSTIKTWPASSSSLSLRYYQEIPALPVASGGSNWVLRKFPGLYLYGSLIEGSAFMEDDARMGTWGALYDRLRQSAMEEDVLAKYARASSRVRGATP